MASRREFISNPMTESLIGLKLWSPLGPESQEISFYQIVKKDVFMQMICDILMLTLPEAQDQIQS